MSNATSYDSSEQKIRCAKISRPDQAGSYAFALTGVQDFGRITEAFADDEVGAILTVELIEMTSAELYALPEWDGW